MSSSIVHQVLRGGPPRAITRSDIVEPNRLQGFSDAVFATAATLLIVPVRKFEMEQDETLKAALLRQWPQFTVFLLGYLVICTLWESHFVRYKVLAKVDDVLVAMNLVSLMIVTFLPFSVDLEGHFAKYEISVLLNAGLLCELAMFIYGFSNPVLLSARFQALEESEKRVKRHQIYIKVLLNCCLFLLAAIFSFASFVVAYILICSVLLTPFMKRIIIKLTELSAQCRFHDTVSTFEVLTGRIDKERLECFTDAAVAIVATLLILDLTTEDFPTEQEVEREGLVEALKGLKEMFISYVGTYVTVAIQWFIHHSVVHHLHIFTPILVVINRTFLAFVAFTPFLSTLNNKYTGHVSSDAQTAVGFSSIILFMGSFTNVLMIIVALFKPDINLVDWARPRDNGNTALIYLTIKALVIPVMAFLTFVISLSGLEASYLVYHVCMYATPVVLILLKVGYACHWRHVGDVQHEEEQLTEEENMEGNGEEEEGTNEGVAVVI
eukprot:TCONS_00049623-protein